MKDEDKSADGGGDAPPDLRVRLTKFGARVVAVCDALPRRRSATVIANQLIRSGTAPGSHYREGIRSRSDAELVSKMETALQELEESTHWLDLIVECRLLRPKRLAALQVEANELISILVTCVKKVKKRRR